VLLIDQSGGKLTRTGDVQGAVSVKWRDHSGHQTAKLPHLDLPSCD